MEVLASHGAHLCHTWMLHVLHRPHGSIDVHCCPCYADHHASPATVAARLTTLQLLHWPAGAGVSEDATDAAFGVGQSTTFKNKCSHASRTLILLLGSSESAQLTSHRWNTNVFVPSAAIPDHHRWKSANATALSSRPQHLPRGPTSTFDGKSGY